MAVTIDESVVLGVAGLVFVPVFVFCIKMIMRTGTLENKIDNMQKQIQEIINDKKEMNKAQNSIQFLEFQVKELEKDVDSINRRFNTEDAELRKRERERKEIRYRREKAEAEAEDNSSIRNRGEDLR